MEFRVWKNYSYDICIGIKDPAARLFRQPGQADAASSARSARDRYITSASQSGRVTTARACSVLVMAAMSGASPPMARAMT
jgi:hypothetical protein